MKVFIESFRTYQPIPMGKERLNANYFATEGKNGRDYTMWREYGNPKRAEDVIHVYEHATKKLYAMPVDNVCFYLPVDQDITDVLQPDIEEKALSASERRTTNPRARARYSGHAPAVPSGE